PRVGRSLTPPVPGGCHLPPPARGYSPPPRHHRGRVRVEHAVRSRGPTIRLLPAAAGVPPARSVAGSNRAMASPGVNGLLKHWVVPVPLFLGAGCAFLACCLGGRVVSGRDCYRDVERFHQFVSPETLFYPTASQVRALLRRRLDPAKVAV